MSAAEEDLWNRIELLEAHVENLIQRMHEMEESHEPWYLAICQDCYPQLAQPFRIGDEMRRWAEEHEEGTGHRVRTEIKWGSRS